MRAICRVSHGVSATMACTSAEGQSGMKYILNIQCPSEVAPEILMRIQISEPKRKWVHIDPVLDEVTLLLSFSNSKNRTTLEPILCLIASPSPSPVAQLDIA